MDIHDFIIMYAVMCISDNKLTSFFFPFSFVSDDNKTSSLNYFEENYKETWLYFYNIPEHPKDVLNMGSLYNLASYYIDELDSIKSLRINIEI